MKVKAHDFNRLLGKQDGYTQKPFNVFIGGSYEKGYQEGQALYKKHGGDKAK